MARGAGRVYARAPISYLGEKSWHTQETWDELTAGGEIELQRSYVIKEKVSALSGKSSKGRKATPPAYWLSESDENSELLWRSYDRKTQIEIRIKYTTGKYRRLIDKERQEQKNRDFFTTEIRGRPVKMSDAVRYIYTMVVAGVSDKAVVFDFIDKDYEYYTDKLFVPLLKEVYEIVSICENIDYEDVCKQLIGKKTMHVHIKAFNAIWERLKGKKKEQKWRRFKYPVGYSGDEGEWNALKPIVQLLSIHDMELTRYVNLPNDITEDFIDSVLREEVGKSDVKEQSNDMLSEDRISLDEYESGNMGEDTMNDYAEVSNLLFSSDEQYISV